MDAATSVDKETLTKETQVTAVEARIHHTARARVTKDQKESGKLTVKLSWEVVGNLDVTKALSDGYWAGLLCVVSSDHTRHVPLRHHLCQRYGPVASDPVRWFRVWFT